MNVPEKWRDIAKAWVDGADVEVRSEFADRWLPVNLLEFHAHQAYRIKPKTKVKKWRWVFRNVAGNLDITDLEYSDAEQGCIYRPRQKIDCTEIEVYE